MTQILRRLRCWLGQLWNRCRDGHVTVVEELRPKANVEAAVYEADELREQYSDWDDLDKAEKLQRVRETTPDRVVDEHNTALNEFLRFLVDKIDPGQTPTDIDTSHLALGNDDSSPSAGDSGLNSEKHRFQYTDSVDNGTDLLVSTFIDSTEANGTDLKEVGLVSASSGGTFFNHSIIDTIPKTADKIVTIEITIDYNP